MKLDFHHLTAAVRVVDAEDVSESLPDPKIPPRSYGSSKIRVVERRG